MVKPENKECAFKVSKVTRKPPPVCEVKPLKSTPLIPRKRKEELLPSGAAADIKDSDPFAFTEDDDTHKRHPVSVALTRVKTSHESKVEAVSGKQEEKEHVVPPAKPTLLPAAPASKKGRVSQEKTLPVQHSSAATVHVAEQDISSPCDLRINSKRKDVGDRHEHVVDPAKDMHYKKNHLLAELKDNNAVVGAEKENGSSSTLPQGSDTMNTSGINLNQSLTDQLARRAKHQALPPPGWQLDREEGYISPGLGDHLISRGGGLGDQQIRTPSELERGSPYSPGGRSDVAERRTPQSSSSPLVLDKSRPVEPYRDPELLKKDSEMRRMATLQSSSQRPPAPSPAAPPPPPVATTSTNPTHSNPPQTSPI